MFGNIQPDETVDIYYNLSSNGKTTSAELGANFRYIADPVAENK